jgi:uncharacterized membrane protein
MPGILLGLTAAICWGVADFCARFASRRIGAFRTLFFMQIVGLVAMTAYLVSTTGISPATAGWRPWTLAALAGVISTLGALALYYAFQIGMMSVVAPISSSYPAITVALAYLSGERLQPHRAVGLAVTIVGVMLAATSFSSNADGAAQDGRGKHAQLTKGVGWSIFAAVAFGVMFWFLGFHVVPLTGAPFSVWMIRFSTMASLGLAAVPARQSLRVPRGSVLVAPARDGRDRYDRFFRQQRRPRHRPGFCRQRTCVALRGGDGAAGVDRASRTPGAHTVARDRPHLRRNRPRQRVNLRKKSEQKPAANTSRTLISKAA